MDPQVGGSFIPKAALTATKQRRGGMGLALVVAILLFVLSLVAAGAVYLYEGVLNAQITSKQSSLTAAEGAFEPDVIQQLSRLDSRITNTENLLQQHLAPSGIFNFLAENTKQDVQFTDFSYAYDDSSGSASITLDGVAGSFSSVALQSDQFGASPYLKDVVFSNVAVGQNGQVGFTVTATLDPSLYMYESEGAATSTAPAASPSATSTLVTPPPTQ